MALNKFRNKNMKKFNSITLLIAMNLAVGGMIVSCGDAEDNNEMSFAPYELTTIADGADSDSLRSVMEDFDGRWSVCLTGVLPKKLGKNDVTELRDSLCRLANLRMDDKDRLEILLPSELKAIDSKKGKGKKDADKAPGSVMTHELSLDLLTPRFAVFRGYTYTYPEGAAHPAFANGYVNYDIEKGKIITYKMIFTDGFQKLLRIAIYDRLIEQGVDVQVEKEDFKVAHQFRLTPSGIEFIYGIYEIAPYSDNEPSVFFDYSELSSILTPLGKEMFLTENE